MSIRSFIAIEIPDDIKDALGRCQKRLRGSDVKVRWTNLQVMHLTTKFIGDVSETDVPKICEAMKSSVEGVSPLELEVATLGAFPPKGPPRILWAGIRGDVETLTELVGEMEKALADEVGIKPEHRRYHPHLTLGRVKSTRGVDRLEALMRENESIEFGAFRADAITLFMSDLKPEGAVHTSMANISFDG